ncbi:MAG: response regulator [Anaerolineales bacterium]|nr:response regulator [Anaerolineales bacterium]
MDSAHALIVDDQQANIEVLAMLLAQQGVTSTAVRATRHLMDTIARLAHIDVVFLDLEMPHSDYHALLPRLKAEPRLAGVPIIAYTVHTSEIEIARRIGFDGFLGKPLRASQFPDQLRRILNGEPVWSLQYGGIDV